MTETSKDTRINKCNTWCLNTSWKEIFVFKNQKNEELREGGKLHEENQSKEQTNIKNKIH